MVEFRGLLTCEPYAFASRRLVEHLCEAEFHKVIDRRFLAREYILDGALACDILNLTAREIKLPGQSHSVFFSDAVAQHTGP